MRKFTIYIITIILSLMLVGCGNTNTDNSNSNSNQVIINMPSDNSVNGYRQNTTANTSNTNMPDTIKSDDIEISTDSKYENSQTSLDDKTESISSVDELETKDEKCCGNKNSKIFHKLTCGSVSKMKNENKNYATRQELIDDGYKACERCQP